MADLDINQFKQIVESNVATLTYFSHERCSVCKILRPRIEILLKNKFPKMYFQYIDADENTEITGQYGVYTVPVIIAFFEGKEFFRFNRNFSLQDLEDKIHRYYDMIVS